MEPVFTSENRGKRRRPVAWRVMAVVLSAVLTIHLLPVEGVNADASEKQEGLCKHHTAHTAECGYVEAEKHSTESVSGNGAGSGEARPCTYVCHICPIEDLINTLPEGVTEDNQDAVREQLKEILALLAELTEEEQEQIDLSRCEKLQGELDAGNKAVGAVVDLPELDLTDPDLASGDLDMDGYYWDKTDKKLSLKNINISTLTLPDETVIIETEEKSTIDKLSIKNEWNGEDANKTKLTFTGTGTLTFEKRIKLNGGNENTITVDAKATVVANGGISIGSSGGVDSIVTVNGTLTVKSADDNEALAAGKVVIGEKGLLDVSGSKGVVLRGISNNYASIFKIVSGGCLQANCDVFNIVVYSLVGSFSESTDQIFDFSPLTSDVFLPTDCELKENRGVINLVRKGTDNDIYTGPLTIHENHDWPEKWNKKDEVNHWKECLVNGCDKTSDLGKHTFDNDTKQCACGAMLSVTLNNADNLVYNGREQKPGVTVTVDVGATDVITLKASNYDVSYTNNTNAGNASVIVKGKDGLTFEQTLNFSIAQDEPVITWNSVSQNAIYTGSQIVITPPDVTLRNGGNFNGEITYSYAKDGSSVYTAGLPVNAGVYKIMAQIAEQGNYIPAKSTALTFTVNQAENAPNMPDDVMRVAWKYKKVSDVELPTDWQWQESDQDTALEINTPVSATAVYTGADRDNYKNVTVTVTITRLPCNHASTEIRNAVAATCQQKGYSGDTYCRECEELLATGTETDLTDHSGGTATCVSGKICEVCGTEYTEKDSSVHLHTEIRGQKNAGCTEEGYTGDTFCTDCNTTISSGTVIPATGHNWQVTGLQEATTTAEGKRTYTCTNCGMTREESIPKLPAEDQTQNPTRPAENQTQNPTRPAENQTQSTTQPTKQPDDKNKNTSPAPENRPDNSQPGKQAETKAPTVLAAEPVAADAAVKSPQTGQPWTPWPVMMMSALAVMIAAGGSLAAKKQKNNHDKS